MTACEAVLPRIRKRCQLPETSSTYDGPQQVPSNPPQ